MPGVPFGLPRLIKASPTDSSMKAARMATLNSQAIRKHFVEVTSAMLMPFAPYCHPVGPPAQAVSGQLARPGASTSPSSGQSGVAQGQPGAAPQQAAVASGQDAAVPGAGAVLGQEPPHLPAFSHAEFIEQLQSSQLPAVLLQRFRTQASMCHNLLLTHPFCVLPCSLALIFLSCSVLVTWCISFTVGSQRHLHTHYQQPSCHWLGLAPAFTVHPPHLHCATSSRSCTWGVKGN